MLTWSVEIILCYNALIVPCFENKLEPSVNAMKSWTLLVCLKTGCYNSIDCLENKQKATLIRNPLNKLNPAVLAWGIFSYNSKHFLMILLLFSISIKWLLFTKILDQNWSFQVLFWAAHAIPNISAKTNPG